MSIKSLFQSGTFTLNSGMETDWRINAEFLSFQDIQTCAILLAKLLPEFGNVKGVPRGGLVLADALQPYITPDDPTILVVDDVWTTGGSWRRYCEEHGYENKNVIGAVIFARSFVPPNVVALWNLDHRLFQGDT